MNEYVRRADERFWAKVVGDDFAACWDWTGALDADGYGNFFAGAQEDVPPYSRAHRYAYVRIVGAIPDGLELDHLCRNRACVNPWHMQPVTRRINNSRSDSLSAKRLRQLACAVGHAFTPENTKVTARGQRLCRTCLRVAKRTYFADRRARLLADPSLAPHGKTDTYLQWGCRCVPCKGVYSSYRAARRAVAA